MSLSASKGFLSGIRILDMSRVLAGPFATMVLGDLGAEIIKVENPQGGDDTRAWGPPFVGSESAYFLSINRNKKSIAVNLKHEKGKEIIKNLVRKSDVFIENFIPGKLTSLSLGYDDLRAVKEDLIYCSITGYGSDGPYAHRAGYDVIASSVGGLNYITGPENGDPCRVGVAVTDISTGLYAHGAILAALWHREKTGCGQKIDCNLLSSQISALSHVASNYLNSGVEAKRWGMGHANIVPYQAFKTKDGLFFTVGAGNDRHFKKLCQLLNIEYLLEDKRYKTNSSRVENRESLIPILKKVMSQKSCEELMSLLDGSGFPYGPINSVGQALNDPQVIHNGMIMEMDHPQAGGRIRVPGSPVHYSDKQCTNPVRPPILGEHTRQVLCELGELSSSQFDELNAEGVVFDGSCDDDS